MKWLKDAAQKMTDYFRAIPRVITGQARRDAEDLRQRLNDLAERAEKTAEMAQDGLALEKFRTRKAAGYFNEAAQRQPGMAEEFQRLAQLAATVDVDKMRGDVNAYKGDETANREWHLVRERYAQEIRTYADAHIQEFIAEDPARWSRIQKTRAEYAGTPKPPAP